MRLPSGEYRPTLVEELLTADCVSQQALTTYKLLWFAASWLPGVLLFPFNWLLEAPLYSLISRHDQEASRRLCWLSSCVAVPLVSALIALLLYPSGQARLLGIHQPEHPERRLDPYTRLHPAEARFGWTDYASLLRRLPNNAVIYLLRSVLGPPAGAYDGPFPSLGEALSALNATGSSLSFASFSSGSFQAGGSAQSLTPPEAQAILQYTSAPAGQMDALLATVYQERCLVLGILDGERLAYVILADLDAGKPFHYYSVPRKDQSVREKQTRTPHAVGDSSGIQLDEGVGVHGD